MFINNKNTLLKTHIHKSSSSIICEDFILGLFYKLRMTAGKNPIFVKLAYSCFTQFLIYAPEQSCEGKSTIFRLQIRKTEAYKMLTWPGWR